MTADQLEMISTNPRVTHGQAVIVGTRVPVSVILDCLAAGMTAEEITAEYPTVTVAGVRAAAAYGAALAREELLPLPQSRSSSSSTAPHQDPAVPARCPRPGPPRRRGELAPPGRRRCPRHPGT